MQNKSDERMKLFNIGLYLAAARRVRGTRRSLAIGTSTRLREDSAWMPGRLAAILPRRSVTLNTDMSTRLVQDPRLSVILL